MRVHRHDDVSAGRGGVGRRPSVAAAKRRSLRRASGDGDAATVITNQPTNASIFTGYIEHCAEG